MGTVLSVVIPAIGIVITHVKSLPVFSIRLKNWERLLNYPSLTIVNNGNSLANFMCDFSLKIVGEDGTICLEYALKGTTPLYLKSGETIEVSFEHIMTVLNFKYKDTLGISHTVTAVKNYPDMYGNMYVVNLYEKVASKATILKKK